MLHKIKSGGDPSCIHLVPGQSGFEELAALVTPLNRIRKPLNGWNTWPEDPQGGRITRNETMDK